MVGAEPDRVRVALLLRQSNALLGTPDRCVHIGDRESDIYELFCAARELGTHFLVRACVDRLAGDGDRTVAAEMKEIARRFANRHAPWPSCQIIFTRSADRLKLLWWDGQGLCLLAKRLERGRFIWPTTKEGSVTLTPAQLSMLLEGLEWRIVERTWKTEIAAPQRAS